MTSRADVHASAPTPSTAVPCRRRCPRRWSRRRRAPARSRSGAAPRSPPRRSCAGSSGAQVKPSSTPSARVLAGGDVEAVGIAQHFVLLALDEAGDADPAGLRQRRSARRFRATAATRCPDRSPAWPDCRRYSSWSAGARKPMPPVSHQTGVVARGVLGAESGSPRSVKRSERSAGREYRQPPKPQGVPSSRVLPSSMRLS
jgi:hypothetical protein